MRLAFILGLLMLFNFADGQYLLARMHANSLLYAYGKHEKLNYRKITEVRDQSILDSVSFKVIKASIVDTFFYFLSNDTITYIHSLGDEKFNSGLFDPEGRLLSWSNYMGSEEPVSETKYTYLNAKFANSYYFNNDVLSSFEKLYIKKNRVDSIEIYVKDSILDYKIVFKYKKNHIVKEIRWKNFNKCYYSYSYNLNRERKLYSIQITGTCDNDRTVVECNAIGIISEYHYVGNMYKHSIKYLYNSDGLICKEIYFKHGKVIHTTTFEYKK